MTRTRIIGIGTMQIVACALRGQGPMVGSF
jgi:hypothetical protein